MLHTLILTKRVNIMKKMQFMVVLCCFMLASCIGNDVYTQKIVHPNALYIGDQMCSEAIKTDDGNALWGNEDYKKTAPYTVGMAHNCKKNRNIDDVAIISAIKSKQWEVVFIALGENDQAGDKDSLLTNSFIEKYQNILDETNADRIVCVLPSKTNVQKYRYAIISLCPNVADPYDYGVTFPYGIRGLGIADQRKMATLIYKNM